MQKSSICFILLISFLCITCNQIKKENTTEETILKGKITIFVDETLQPIIEDQIQIFESRYDAKINTKIKSEGEMIVEMVNSPTSVGVFSRKLNENETKQFKKKKIIPVSTKFATDAIALIRSKNSNDTLIELDKIFKMMQGEEFANIKGLVFDNPNSSTVHYISELAKIKSLPKRNFYSFKTNNEVIKYISKNPGMIGIVGYNWISQPMPNMQTYVDKVRMLSVKAPKGKEYYVPNQTTIADKNYPLLRDLYIVNCQGYSGLGMGFASFVAGDVGQRIVLKSGLLPEKIPTRNLSIRKNIE